ncbi:MAG: SDR family NAD(P)-dependent oxidoreductase, partial [Pseudomonadota bacterium]
MDLYRVSPGDGVVWITGASAGIGRELAFQMAKQGYTIVATARGEDKLASLIAGNSMDFAVAL